MTMFENLVHDLDLGKGPKWMSFVLTVFSTDFTGNWSHGLVLLS